MGSEYSAVQAAVDAISRGEVIIVVDAEDRENEGDFICAAEKATPEVVNFILTGRGEFCVPVLPEVCKRLELKPIVESNTAPLSTAPGTPRSCSTPCWTSRIPAEAGGSNARTRHFAYCLSYPKPNGRPSGCASRSPHYTG